jgi:hypothetical protein
MKSLTFEQARGTKTFYLPFERGSTQQPEVTLMVRRLKDKSFEAGLAVCSREDQFHRRQGRILAFHRLNGCPVRGTDEADLLWVLRNRFDQVNWHHPETIGGKAYEDLYQLPLDKTFDRLERNRQELEFNQGAFETLYWEEGGGC